MRQIFTLLILLVVASSQSFAQQDSSRPVIHSDTINLDTSRYDIHQADTMKIGRILIIKMKDKKADTVVVLSKARKRSTSWFTFDLGFSNYNDQTNYAAGPGYLMNDPAAGVPALGKSDFKPRNGKSMNVNLSLIHI